MSEPNGTTMQFPSLFEPCKNCSTIRRLLLQLANCVANDTKVPSVQVKLRPVGEGVPARRIVFCDVLIECLECGSKGQVLTDAGRQVLDMLRNLGVVPDSVEREIPF